MNFIHDAKSLIFLFLVVRTFSADIIRGLVTQHALHVYYVSIGWQIYTEFFVGEYAHI